MVLVWMTENVWGSDGRLKFGSELSGVVWATYLRGAWSKFNFEVAFGTYGIVANTCKLQANKFTLLVWGTSCFHLWASICCACQNLPKISSLSLKFIESTVWAIWDAKGDTTLPIVLILILHALFDIAVEGTGELCLKFLDIFVRSWGVVPRSRTRSTRARSLLFIMLPRTCLSSSSTTIDWFRADFVTVLKTLLIIVHAIFHIFTKLLYGVIVEVGWYLSPILVWIWSCSFAWVVLIIFFGGVLYECVGHLLWSCKCTRYETTSAFYICKRCWNACTFCFLMLVLWPCTNRPIIYLGISFLQLADCLLRL